MHNGWKLQCPVASSDANSRLNGRSESRSAAFIDCHRTGIGWANDWVRPGQYPIHARVSVLQVLCEGPNKSQIKRISKQRDMLQKVSRPIANYADNSNPSQAKSRWHHIIALWTSNIKRTLKKSLSSLERKDCLRQPWLSKPTCVSGWLLDASQTRLPKPALEDSISMHLCAVYASMCPSVHTVSHYYPNPNKTWTLCKYRTIRFTRSWGQPNLFPHMASYGSHLWLRHHNLQVWIS